MTERIKINGIWYRDNGELPSPQNEWSGCEIYNYNHDDDSDYYESRYEEVEEPSEEE